MEIFYSKDFDGYSFVLSEEESQHCVRVLRRRKGDAVNVIDGSGTLFKCIITSDAPKRVEAQVQERVEGWGSHPYKLTLAVCPTKNNDRYEWFAEKATEFGVDCIVPVIGERSERRVFKTDRLRRVVLSAVKQSLKGAVPEVAEPVSVKEFIASCQASCKLIAYCFDDASTPRRSITEVLSAGALPLAHGFFRFASSLPTDGWAPPGKPGVCRTPCKSPEGTLALTGEATGGHRPVSQEQSPGNDIAVLIGPEGDFSPEEARMAIAAGFVPIHLGESRLRTETAAIAAVAAVYFHHI